MKGQAGIDLADLTEAQRKMCVKLLALNNVQFTENQNGYIATLKVPTTQVNNYLLKQNSQSKKDIKPQPKANKKQNKQNKQIKKQQIESKSKISKSSSEVKKQNIKINYGRKSLFKAVKIMPIPKLQLLCPEIQVYIYPKKLPFPFLQQQIQQIYEQYWQYSKTNNNISLVNVFYQVTCPLFGLSNKSKNDQSLVNTLQSINHFQHKQIGVKMFLLFLSQSFSKEQLSYFLVLRALIQQFSCEKIFNLKSKQKDTTLNNSSSFSISPKQKLKWSPSEKQIPQHICQQFLKVVITNTENIHFIFEKLTQRMYYCETKRNNFIRYYDLIQFMLQQFDKECYEASVSHLELSYSNNGSTINDIFLQTDKKVYEEPTPTKIEVKMIPQFKHQQMVMEEPQIIDNDIILIQHAIQKTKQMCKRMQMPFVSQNQIIEKVKQCIESLIAMDKMKWVQVMDIQGTEEQLFFIQETQLQYRKMCSQNVKLAMPNNLVKRILSGPGFIRLFSSHVTF